jgi:hypothetical protein
LAADGVRVWRGEVGHHHLAVGAVVDQPADRLTSERLGATAVEWLPIRGTPERVKPLDVDQATASCASSASAARTA